MARIRPLSCGHRDCKRNGGMCCLIWCKLPEDLIIEVLYRLPTNPLFRFTCVSKAWNDIIFDVSIPRRVVPHTPVPGFIFKRRSDLAPCGNGFLTLDGHYYQYALSCYVRTRGFTFCTMRSDGLVGCYNGLLLFAFKTPPHPHVLYFVHNPATKQCVSIPVNPMQQDQDQDQDDDAFVGMAFDPLHPYQRYNNNNTYKIIVRMISSSSNKSELTHNFIDIFSSITGKWATTPIPLDPLIIGSSWMSQSLYLKGNFYVLSFSRHLLCFDLHATATDDNNKLLSASAVELPSVKATLDSGGLGSISLSNEFLYYYRDDEEVTFNIWLYEKSALIPKYSINIDKLRQLSCGRRYLSSSFIPLAVDPAYDHVIYIGNGSGKVVLKYDIETNKLELFHQFDKYTRIVNGTSCFQPYKPCLVKLSEFSKRLLIYQ